MIIDFDVCGSAWFNWTLEINVGRYVALHSDFEGTGLGFRLVRRCGCLGQR
jgi:hypothetical protein